MKAPVATRPRTVLDALTQAADNPSNPSYNFLADGERLVRRLSCADLGSRARDVAAALGPDRRGERVILPHRAGLDFVIAYFGCLYAGAIAVPVPPPNNRHTGSERLRLVAADSGASVLLCAAKDTPEMAAIAQPLDVSVIASDDLPHGLGAEWPGPAVDADQIIHLQYSSGSTGTPKGVIMRHSEVIDQLSYYQRLSKADSRTGIVSWLPSFHDLGLVTGVLLPAFLQSSVWLMDPLSFVRSPLRWLSAISEYRAGLTAAPNFAYDLCVRRATPERCQGLDLRWLHFALNGAEPVRAGTLDQFVATFGPYGFCRRALSPGYGLAEATLIVTGTPRDSEPTIVRADDSALRSGVYREAADGARSRDLVASGHTDEAVQVAIADPGTLSPRPDGQVGEILVSGSVVASGYWADDEATARTFRARPPGRGDSDWLRTGDLGFLMNGELFVTGRLKDVVIVDGLNHYSHDIERTVEASHSAIRPERSIVFAVEDGQSERVIVVAEVERRGLRDDSGTAGVARDPDAATNEVITAVRRAVAEEHGVAVAEIVLLRSSRVPLTSSGKRRRLQCRDDFLAGALR